MTTRPRPLEALEISLRRLRLLGVVFIVGAALLRRGPTSLTIPGAMLILALTALLLIANVASKRMSRPAASVERLVMAQLVIDVVVTSAALLYYAPRPGTFGWVVVGLPVLEGTMRYRLTGAASVWLAITTTLMGWAIIGWSPGDGLESIVDLAGMLSIGLGLGIPGGHIADQLTEELLSVADQRREAERRSRLLAVLAVAGNDLTILDERGLCLTAAQATIELGYECAQVGILDLTTADWQPVHQEPETFTLPGLSDDELSRLPETGDGSIVGVPEGSDLIGVLESDATHAVLIRVRAGDGDEASPARGEALAMLCATTATALAAAARHADLDRAREQLQHEATHDELTGILNRAGLLKGLEVALTQVGSGRRARMLMMIDLDGFKAVNDTNGHEAGDAVLVEVAARLQDGMPEQTTVARLGGDEFVLVVPASHAIGLQQRLERVIERPITTPAGIVSVGASIGTHVLDDPECTPAEALRQADARMYATKASRKQRSIGPDRGHGFPDRLEFSHTVDERPASEYRGFFDR